jgi:hypothetical protein
MELGKRRTINGRELTEIPCNFGRPLSRATQLDPNSLQRTANKTKLQLNAEAVSVLNDQIRRLPSSALSRCLTYDLHLALNLSGDKVHALSLSLSLQVLCDDWPHSVAPFDRCSRCAFRLIRPRSPIAGIILEILGSYGFQIGMHTQTHVIHFTITISPQPFAPSHHHLGLAFCTTTAKFDLNVYSSDIAFVNLYSSRSLHVSSLITSA